MANHYQTLGLPNFSSSRDIQKAFRRLAIKYHPDKNGGKKIYEEKFKQVNAAYQLLSDVNKKAVYDQYLIYGIEAVKQQSSHSNRHTKSSKTKNYNYQERSRDYNSPKPETVYKYSPFQKLFIKVSIVSSLMFAVIAFFVLVFGVKLNHAKKFKEDYVKLITRTEESRVHKNYFVMESQVDSLYLYSSQGYDYQTQSQVLCSELNDCAVGLYNEGKFSESLQFHNFYHQSCLKYNVFEPEISKVRGIELHFIQGELPQAKAMVDDLLLNGISIIKNGALLADILIRNNEYVLAERVVSLTIEDLLNTLSGRYGALYLDVIEQEGLSESMKNAFIQYICLNRNFSKKDKTVLEDFMLEIIESESDRDSYRFLQQYQFDRGKIKLQNDNPELNVFLTRVNLKRFFLD